MMNGGEREASKLRDKENFPPFYFELNSQRRPVLVSVSSMVFIRNQLH